MNLLGSAFYDPAVAETKATDTLLAMTAFDTTNLRIAFTIPAHGKVFVRLVASIHGAAPPPVVLMGVLDGSTVRARMPPDLAQATAATQIRPHKIEVTLSGLTPGAANWDAAYGVENVTASTAFKYGGPNDTTGNNAFGGILFEVWDPQPQTTTGQLSVDANGRVDVIKIAGTTQTARDLGASVITASISTGGISAASFAAGAVDAAALAADAGTEIGTAVWATTTRALTDKAGFSLSAAGITAIWAEVMEGAVSAVQMMRGFAAALLGKASGLDGTTALYRDTGDTKDRITATVDSSGNRTAVTRDLT